MIKRLSFLFPFLMFACIQSTPESRAQGIPATDSYFNLLSINFLTALKEGRETTLFIEKLAQIDIDSLKDALEYPAQKKAFWINTYNAYIQHLLKNDTSLYNSRSTFFSKEQINIGGQLLSFDDIEHGILRGSTWKLSLGYIKNPFAPAFETKFRMSETDPRIHFALNCGAMSCPPIAIFSSNNFDRRINAVARQFLQAVSSYSKEKNEVETTALFSWFRGDFGGTSGARKLLIQYGVLPKESDASIVYAEYDWTMKLAYYYED